VTVIHNLRIMKMISQALLAAAQSQDTLFIVIMALLVVGGAALVYWSRRKGSKTAEAGTEAAEKGEVARPEEALPEEREEEVEEKPELLPLGRTIQDGLEKTRTRGFVSRLAGLFRRQLDEDIEQKMEEVLLTSDIGVKTARKLLAGLKSELTRTQLKDSEVVWDFLKGQVRALLGPVPLETDPGDTATPYVIAVIGVNGTGKTTTIGKLAARLVRGGKKVMVVAADTFRAAAEDQLAIWAERSGATFHRGREKQDPASVAFDGIRKGVEEGADVILIDTAGRLHTQKNLVGELKKIARVCGKALEGAPHETLLVLDATTGQNAIQQANIFRGEVGVQGIVLTKLDGTAKGGVVIGICDMLQIPVKYVGVGESVADLLPFSPDDFVEGLFGAS